jgi:hypothetical protein
LWENLPPEWTHPLARDDRVRSSIDNGPNGAFHGAIGHGKGLLDMARTSRAIIGFSAAVFAFAALASCGSDRGADAGGDAKGGTGAETAQAAPLFPDDFKGVCSGASVSAATAYDPDATAHRALYFATYRDDFTDRSSSLPGDWTVQWSPEGDALRAIDLVVCARRTDAREARICDGYRKNGRETRNRVRWHHATYALSVHEASTGRQLAETTA